MSNVNDLVTQLNDQMLQMEQTVQKLKEEAMKSDDHNLKYFVLTELYSKHFGAAGLPTLCQNITKYTKK